ncbi:unnamed protein product [Rhizoctonia solani]|nr:unnamed protein product [Rhizoctonia solani]
MTVLQGKVTMRKTKKKKKRILSALLKYGGGPSKPKYLSDMVESKRQEDGTNLSGKQEDSSPTTYRDAFIRLPVEVLIEIISHLLPVDVISLSRCNKFFRNWLMSQTSRYIWASTMENIEDLPACPPDMSEPYYSALLFMPSCTICGESKDCELYLKLRLRLCGTCRSNYLMTIRRFPRGEDYSCFPEELDDLVHNVTEYTGSACAIESVSSTMVKKEADDIRLRFEELHQSGDQVALNTWKKERAAVVKERQHQAYAIEHSLKRWKYSQSINPTGASGS